MDIYIYQGALWCEDCIDAALGDGSDGAVDSGDSDTYPQGPYGEGGGEADVPQHCDGGDTCYNAEVIREATLWCDRVVIGAFLGNPLTAAGHYYVQEAVNNNRDAHNTAVVKLWGDFYGITKTKKDDE